MEWGSVLCCLALSWVRISASTADTFNKIEDLKDTTFGREYPRHGLLLLHWLANHISIGHPDDILLHFEPARQDYGFRRCKNMNGTNATLPGWDDPGDRAYFVLGGLSSEAVRTKLPPYVTQDYYNAVEDPGRDLDRIVLRVRRSDARRADRVYITQVVTSHGDVDFDLEETFQISPNLLAQVQLLNNPVDLIQALELHVAGTETPRDPRLALPKDQLLHHLKHSVKRLQPIYEDSSTRWLLILAGYDIDNRYDIHKKTWFCSDGEQIQRDPIFGDPETLCQGHHVLKIEVKSTENGYAKIIWSGLPKNIRSLNTTVVLFRSDTSNDLQRFTDILDQTSGFYETYLALKNGLQPRLVTYRFSNEYGFIGLRYSVLWRGPQFDEADRAIPTGITGHDASLQLYTKYGYACARLYIRKSFTGWKTEFANSWVSFYASDQDKDDKYENYQWATKFEEVDDSEEYRVYEYASPTSIRPGVQARFLSTSDGFTLFSHPWSSATVKARTLAWESDNN